MWFDPDWIRLAWIVPIHHPPSIPHRSSLIFHHPRSYHSFSHAWLAWFVLAGMIRGWFQCGSGSIPAHLIVIDDVRFKCGWILDRFIHSWMIPLTFSRPPILYPTCVHSPTSMSATFALTAGLIRIDAVPMWLDLVDFGWIVIRFSLILVLRAM